MKRITINGLELEIDDNCKVEIEGQRVTVKAPEQNMIQWNSPSWVITTTAPGVSTCGSYTYTIPESGSVS